MRCFASCPVLLGLPCAVIVAESVPPGEPFLFADATAGSGLENVVGAQVAFVDLNSDGYPDVVVDATRVFLNVGGRSFVEAGESLAFPPADPGPGFKQYADVDNDGRIDVFAGNRIDPRDLADRRSNAIWRQSASGRFEKVEDAGIERHREASSAAAFVDYDRDGNVDLFVGGYYVPGEGFEAYPDRLYRGRGDGTFVEVTERAGLMGSTRPGQRASNKPTFGVSHLDWNGDGWPDLITMSFGRQWNHLWRNNRDGTFTDVGFETHYAGDDVTHGRYDREDVRGLPFFDDPKEPPFRANGNTTDAAVADYDGDGDLDVFLAEVAHWWAGDSSDRSSLLVNLGAARGYTFDRVRIARQGQAERWNEGDLHAGWLDVDNDGRLDLIVAPSNYTDSQHLRMFHQEPDHSFVEWTDRLGFLGLNPSQISLADFDRAGATDLLVATTDRGLPQRVRLGRDVSIRLYRNLANERFGNRFLNVRLEGEPVGARVTATVAGQRQVRESQSALGNAGHRDDTDARFGLGKASVVDELEVAWPGLPVQRQVFRHVAVDRFYRLRRGGTLEAMSR